MNITTNTTTEFPVKWKGGAGRISLSGTFDGATATIVTYQEADTEWVSVGTSGAFTAAGQCIIEAGQGTRIGIVTADGTAPDINVEWNYL